eukprot:TRINITY_DN1744_c3_g1_i7.p1 TRINITY_DN1744_c3_g1~~TRINITY_DN1744_c3_g1_i7.p1  ORF type:complete len:366 (-),score=53.28 TRINITY_DN1744_c3_g1_i7:147-1205(-)
MVLTCTFRGQFVCSVAHQTNVRSVVSKRKLYNCCSESRIDSQNVVYITDQDLENKFKQLTDDPQAAETDPKNQEEERGLLQEEFGTCSSEVAAVEGDEVTIVCAGGNKQKRGILNNSPPGKQIGEVMQVSNHSTGVVCVTERAPARSQQSGQVPSWLLPAVVLFAASDTASSLIDPNLPLIIGMGTVASIGSTLLASNVLWPQLKKIPQNTLAKEQQRQLLLGQHENMAKKLTSIIKEAEDNIRKLAKLSQLRSKMQSVGQQDAYGSRLIQVAEAISTLQHQLKRNIQLVEGYSKVVNMIEIEVEMESDIINQDKGIQKQMQRLLEVEQMAEEWQYQVEAKEELNRILKTYE